MQRVSQEIQLEMGYHEGACLTIWFINIDVTELCLMSFVFEMRIRYLLFFEM